MTTLDDRTMQLLRAVATDDEIAGLLKIINEIERGHVEMWMLQYIADIVGRVNTKLATHQK